MTDYLHSGANKMNKVEAYKNDNKLLLADKLGHAKVSSLKEQNLLNTIATVQQHSNKITQLEADANKVRGAYVYKGTVETEFDLPLNNNSVGDVYNTSSTGMNYAWNGENWDELGGESSNTSSSSSEWIWNPTPIYDEILTDGYYYDIEDDIPYELPSNIFGNGLENLLIFIEKDASTGATAELVGSCYWSTSIPNLDGVITKYRQNTTNNVVKLSACFSITKEHGQYIGKAFSRLRQGATFLEAIPDPSPIHIIYTDLTVSSAKITSFSLSESLPAGTHVTVYTAL